jgi:hypothetical protein
LLEPRPCFLLHQLIRSRSDLYFFFFEYTTLMISLKRGHQERCACRNHSLLWAVLCVARCISFVFVSLVNYVWSNGGLVMVMVMVMVSGLMGAWWWWWWRWWWWNVDSHLLC